MIGQQPSPKPDIFQDMVALTLDVGMFTSEFRLCNTIAEYLASLLAQSHEDPARYANFSSALINELLELVFRSAKPPGKIDFTLLKNEACVRVLVAFTHKYDDSVPWETFDGSVASSEQQPAQALMILARAIGVDLDTRIGGENRVMLIADFIPREGFR